MRIVQRALIGVALPVLLAASAWSTGFEISGIGTAAQGMGGAFRAIANDWSAAYYNPAGYGFFRSDQLGGTHGLFHNRHEVEPRYYYRDAFGTPFRETGVFNDQTIYNQHAIRWNPSAGFAVLLPILGESVWGLSVYQTFDHNDSWRLFSPLEEYTRFRLEDTPDSLSQIPNNQFFNNLDVVAFQLTVAKELEPDRLSIGVGLQLLRGDLHFGDLDLRPTPVSSPVGDRPRDLIPQFSYHEGYGWGFGITGGLMFKPNERASIGVTFSLPSSITIDGDAELRFVMPQNEELNRDFQPGTPEFLFTAGTPVTLPASFETELDLPASFGIGVAYELIEDKLLISADARYTLWSSFEGLAFTYSDFDPDAIDDLNRRNDDPTVNTFFLSDLANATEWENAGEVAFGARYTWSSDLALLGGVSYAQSPARENIGFSPQFSYSGDELGLHGGVLLTLRDNWEIGAAFQYIDYDEITVTELQDVNNDGIIDSFPGRYQPQQYETTLSVVYRF